MLIPRYWAKAEASGQAANGRTFDLRAWGVSPDSQADARADARKRLDAWLVRLRGGHEPSRDYLYQRSVIREELLREIAGPDREPIGMVTRNRYGAEVLNATRALFLDVDLPAGSTAKGLIGLFRRAKPADEAALEGLRAALSARAGEAFRIYRTAAGFRALCTSRPFDPTAAETESLMRATGTDPAYLALCRVQKCFRARLTPKPWRIGLSAASSPFLDDEAPHREASRAWVERYRNAAAGFATCRLVEQIGSAWPHPELRPIVDLHDAACRIGVDLPLA